MIRPRHLSAAAAAAVLALSFAGAAAGGGALHASASLVDTTGHSVGWARFTEDATGIVPILCDISSCGAAF